MSDRVDLARLKEAVNPGLVGAFGGRSVVTMPREEFEVVHGAARSVSSAPAARWCIAHNREANHAWQLDNCKIVTVALVPVGTP